MIEKIKRAIELSALVYEDEPDLTHFSWIENKATDTQVLVCEDDDNAWVVFRGTTFNMKDFETDLKCKLVAGPYGLVHQGFHDAVKSVYVDINIATGRYRLDKKPIIVTGHSLGAACANIYCAMKSWLQDPMEVLITFGGPRSMSKNAALVFGKDYGKKIYSVVNNNDIVTRVPPGIMGFGHVPNTNLYYLDEDGHLHHDPSWWFRFKDRVKGRLYDFGEWGTDGLKDHSTSEYQRILNSL